jgi:hypothetical protein
MIVKSHPFICCWRSKTLLIDHTLPPLVVDWPKLDGPFNVPLGHRPDQFIINVDCYRKVSVLVTSAQGTPPSSAEIVFGVLSSKRSLGNSFEVCLNKTETLDIAGPQMRCNLLNPDADKPLACLARLYLFFTS